MSPLTVADIEQAIARRFPPERAESWDRIGLLAGDPHAEVTGVALALDPTRQAIAETAARGANVLVTHHPAFLEPPSCFTPGPGAGGTVHAALSSGVALVNAHTNLDRDPDGQRLLPLALGLEPAMPLERSPMPMTLVTVYIPPGNAERLVAEMTAAGAGRLGEYAGCSFSSVGIGSYTPSSKADPLIGRPTERSVAEEQRIEMVCPRSRTHAVIAAAVAAHPYEEPLVTASDVSVARNGAALGMVCEPQRGLSLRALVAEAVSSFGCTPRVWGDPGASAGTVVTTTGSAGSLVGTVLAAGADTLVCGEVRYHDALDAKGEGLSIIELGHDVSEWPLVALLEDALRELDDLDPGAIHRLPAVAGWWTP